MTVERMIELLEIEKECVLRNASGECNRYCAGCDLLQDDTELHEMYTEAIALLKAQEPRVIKVAKYDDEIQSPGMDCFTWIEEREREDVYIGTVNRTSHMNYGDETYSFIRFWGKSKDGIKFEDYGKTWRCWTSRPTDAQREATPWE